MAEGKTRISETLRTQRTTAVMLAVLVISLGLGFAISAGRRSSTTAVTSIHAGTITVHIPGQWIAAPRPETIRGALDTVTYTNAPSADRAITIGRIRDTRPRAPSVALEAAVNLLLGAQAGNPITPRNTAIRVTAGPLTGQIHAGVQTIGDERQINVVAVVTVDARAYWTVVVRHRIAGSAGLGNRLKAATALVTDVVRQIDGQPFRAAQDRDLRRAGLEGLTWPDTLEPVVLNGQHQSSPPWWIPKQRFGLLQVWRARAIPDLTVPSLGLTPQTVLDNDFRRVVGRAPQANESWAGRILDHPAWRVGHVMTNQGLVRQLFYVQLSDGRGLLMELLAEPAAVPAASQWLQVIVGEADADHVRAAVDTSSPTDRSIQAAIARGAQVVNAQNSNLSQYLKPGWHYALIESDGQPVGCEVTQIARDQTDDTYPIQGRTITLLFSPDHIRILRIWRTSPQGDRWWCQTLQRVGTNQDPDAQVAMTRVTLTDGELTISAGPEQPGPAWTGPAPPGLVGQAIEDFWPTSAFNPESSGPTVVWMTHGYGPPKPYWINRIPRQNTDAQPWAGQVLIRPLSAIETDRGYVGHDGRIQRHISQRLTSLFQGATVVARTVDRDTLLAAFGALDQLLKSWENDESFEDQDNTP